MINTKKYLRIGFVFSLIAHIGIFALGGYAMNSITKSMENAQEISQQDDITYIEPQDDISDAGNSAPASFAEPDIVVSDSAAPSDAPAQEAAPKEEDPPAAKESPAVQNESKDKPRPLRRLSDLKNVNIGKIKAAPFRAENISVQSSIDFQPTIISEEDPVYDYSLIPPDEEIHIVVSYLLTDPISVEFTRISENDLPPEVLEDLKVAVVTALQNSKIKPPKDPAARNAPFQKNFTLTNRGALKMEY